MIAALVITAISREDRAPRLFTHTATLSPVLKKKDPHAAFKYKIAARIKSQYKERHNTLQCEDLT